MSIFGEHCIEERTFLKEGRLVRALSTHAGVSCRGYSAVLQRLITDFGTEKSFAKAAMQLKEHCEGRETASQRVVEKVECYLRDRGAGIR